MRFYNLSVDIRRQKCVVVGGGKVALRKARKLLSSGAEVVVVALDFLPEFHQEGGFTLVQTGYSKDLIEGATLVFAATSDFNVNQQVCEDAKSLGIWVNSVNGVEYGSFIIPASCSNGILTISITTEGQAPLLSKHLRKYFQKRIENVRTELLEEIVTLRKEMVNETDENRKAALEIELTNKTKEIIVQIEQ